jgi:hypothetical protein
MTDEPNLHRELSALLNSYSVENRSDTPDFVLATFMLQCLSAFNVATRMRTNWYTADKCETVCGKETP